MATADLLQATQRRLVITHDPGGPIEARAREIAELRHVGTAVEIRGDCWSSCTMYLALPATCVSRDAILGFHGPSSSSYGIGLTPQAFETASQLMAAHYPARLRLWFLREGRMRIVGFHRFSGRDLIRLGIPEC